MLDSFNEELQDIKAKKRRSDKLKGDKRAIENGLERERNKLQQLKLNLEKEGKDVEKLEGFSFTGLFNTMLGKKEAMLEKEQQEYLAAKLKYDEAVGAVKKLSEDEALIKKELAELNDVDSKYSRLMKEKEERILDMKDAAAESLLRLQEDIQDLRSDIKELQEAISAGRGAVEEANVAIDYLSSARSWGTWDMLGGGLISTAIKHSKIDDATAAISSLKHRLRIFHRELMDVDSNASLVDIEIGSFLTFADYFFDGFFVDWMVQSKIVDSLEQVHSLKSKLYTVIEKLEYRLKQQMASVNSKEEDKRNLIEGL